MNEIRLKLYNRYYNLKKELLCTLSSLMTRMKCKFLGVIVIVRIKVWGRITISRYPDSIIN